jgi:hypothetical protein
MRIRTIFLSAVFAGLSACASYSGSGLTPGASTEEEVVATMGEPALVREAPDGGKVLWYPRLPFGRQSFAATIDRSGRLVSIEQRLDPQFISRLRPNQSTADDVLDLLGPPNRVDVYPRMPREVWEYQLRTPPDNMNLYVQMTPDRVVREVYQLHDWPKFPFWF